MLEDIVAKETITKKIIHPNTVLINHRKKEYAKVFNTLSRFLDFSVLHIKIEEAIIKGRLSIRLAKLNSIKKKYTTIGHNYSKLSSIEIARHIKYIEKGIIIDDVCVKQPLLLSFQALCPEPYYIDWVKNYNDYYLVLGWGIPPPSKKNCYFL